MADERTKTYDWWSIDGEWLQLVSYPELTINWLASWLRIADLWAMINWLIDDQWLKVILMITNKLLYWFVYHEDKNMFNYEHYVNRFYTWIHIRKTIR
jgi:hypothetical protein